MTLKVAFVCVGNSARSQMAEGLARYWVKKLNLPVEVYSAGSNPIGYIHPLAIRVMREKGIDISRQRSKHLREIPLRELDFVFVLCREEDCPYIPYGRVVNWHLPDPAGFEGTVEERLEFFRRVRDAIEERILDFLKRVGRGEINPKG